MPLAWKASSGAAKFQSAPGREVGRCGRPWIIRPTLDGFNPRPAVRSGDAAKREAEKDLEAVSIRARP